MSSSSGYKSYPPTWDISFLEEKSFFHRSCSLVSSLLRGASWSNSCLQELGSVFCYIGVLLEEEGGAVACWLVHWSLKCTM